MSDRKLAVDSSVSGTVDHYLADIKSSQDYYPFGMLMPDRNFSSDDYRYGFNGMEKDDEITGTVGSHYTAEFWQYDSRLVACHLSPWKNLFYKLHKTRNMTKLVH